jgi:hypothetical protein
VNPWTEKTIMMSPNTAAPTQLTLMTGLPSDSESIRDTIPATAG